MTCGRNRLAAIACGKKFENGHQDHLCADCALVGTELCFQMCFYGIECLHQRRTS